MSSLLCKIVEISEKEVTVEIEGQNLILDKKCLPDELSGKDQFKIFFFNIKNPKEISDKHLAKTILEEILNGQ